MIPRSISQKPLSRVTVFIFGLAFIFTMSGCGGSGGGSEPVEPTTVTISGKVDDGTANSPIQNAQCRFVDQSWHEHDKTFSLASGEFRLNVPPGYEGLIKCTPPNLNSLTLTTFATTIGETAGSVIPEQNVTPATSVVAQIVQAENPPDKKTRKEELLRNIGASQDSQLALLVLLATRLYKEMLNKSLDVNFADGGGNGGGNGDGGGVGGDAGDGGDTSPIPNARCEFVVDNNLGEGASVLYNAALADFSADGILNRPDLNIIKDTINKEFKGREEEIKAAFSAKFPSGFGSPYFDITDEKGEYFLAIPPNVPGFVRCLPPEQEKLILATYVPELLEGEERLGERVNPATTVFSTNIATKLSGDLATIKDNFLADIDGLDVQILQKGGVVSGFQLRPGTAPADKDVGLVAFSAVSLFNIFYKNGVNVDYLAALDDFTNKGEVDPVFLQNTLGVPTAQANEFSSVVDESVTRTGTSVLGTDIGSALSTARIIVMVTDSPGGDVIPGATVDIIGDISCNGCGTSTDSAGIVTLTLTGVPAEATEITVEASGVSGFGPANATIKVVAFATVNLEIPLIVRYPLSVQIGGTGSGTVTSSPAGIDCGADCMQEYVEGTPVTLSAAPAGGSTFSGWSGGGCSGTGPCTVTMDQARAVTATFALVPQPTPDYTLSVTRSGAGSGTVTSSPAGINCGADCTQDYVEGTPVTLSAAPASGSTFTGWSAGGCSGTGPCTVTMDQARAVTATFALEPQPTPDYALSVTRSGTGSGTVTSSPAGINCGADCTQDYVEGTTVTLSAAPAAGSTFTGWSAGGCSGTGSCTVTMNQARTVTATFTALFTLTVQGGSNGTGVVISSPGGISCSINGTTESGDCSQAYSSNTLVTLTPDPSGSSTFTGWSGGGCSGTGPCTVIMNQARVVTANFTVPFTLTVQGGSTGTGVVSSSPGGISCSINGTMESGDCSQEYTINSRVILTPDPSKGSTFDGWSGGGCSGTGPCTVTMTQSQTVTALFTLPPIAPTISNIRQQLEDSQYTCIRSDGSTFTGYYYRISVNYDDPNGDVTRGDEAVVRLDGADFQWYSFSGDGFTGTATADPCYESEQSGRRFSMTVVDGAGLESNSLSITIP